jgi:hypothetical protein
MLADSILMTSKNNAEVAAAQAEDMQNVHELAMATKETLQRLHADKAVQVRKPVVIRRKLMWYRISTDCSTR